MRWHMGIQTTVVLLQRHCRIMWGCLSILLWNLWRKSLVLCGKLLFTLVSDPVIQSSWFMITTVSFAVSGLTTTWTLNLKHFSQWQFLIAAFIAGYYNAKSKTVSNSWRCNLVYHNIFKPKILWYWSSPGICHMKQQHRKELKNIFF